MNYFLNYETKLKELGIDVPLKGAFYSIISSSLGVGFLFFILVYLNISVIDIIGFAYPYCLRSTVVFFAMISLYISTIFCDGLNEYIASTGYDDDDNDLNYNIEKLNIALDKYLEFIVLFHDLIHGSNLYNDFYQLINYICLISNTLELSCNVIIAYLGDWKGRQLQILFVIYTPGYFMYFTFYYLIEIMNVKVRFFKLVNIF